MNWSGSQKRFGSPREISYGGLVIVPLGVAIENSGAVREPRPERLLIALCFQIENIVATHGERI
jgi:hypothetical protein